MDLQPLVAQTTNAQPHSDSEAVRSLPPASRWQYRIEGGQKMIFAPLPPPCSLPHKSELPKPLPTLPPQILVVYPTLTKYNVPSDHVFNNPQALIEKHLGPFLVPQTPIALTPPYLAELAKIAQPNRPAHRTSTITAHSTAASLQPDAALYFGAKTCLVELKPKYAHLSRSRLIPPRNAKVLKKYTTLMYHMKNYIMPTNTIPAAPYDPGDLLSSSFDRVIRSIGKLVYHNSRSIRIFEGGKLVPSAKSHEHFHAMRVAARVLTTYNECSQAVKDVQAYDILDGEGSETVMKRLISLVGKDRAYELIREELYVDTPHDKAFDKLCYESAKQASGSHNEELYQKAVAAVGELTETQCARLLARFLQAYTAKDLSILISICPRNEMQDVTLGNIGEEGEGVEGDLVQCGDELWVCKVWVVDVGEKSIDKILGRWGPDERKRVEELRKRAHKWRTVSKWNEAQRRSTDGGLVVQPFW